MAVNSGVRRGFGKVVLVQVKRLLGCAGFDFHWLLSFVLGFIRQPEAEVVGWTGIEQGQ
jgi:hypothetical protein